MTNMFYVTVRAMVMSAMCRMIMTDVAGSQGCDEDCKADEHADASPAEVAGFLDSASGLTRNDSVRTSLARNESVRTSLTRNRRCIVSALMFACMVMQLETLAVGLYAAVIVVMLMTVLRMFSIIYLVYNYTDNDRQNKQYREQD